MVLATVSDPVSFFTDPDPGCFLQTGSGSKQQKPVLLRQKQNFRRNFCFQPKKYRRYGTYLFFDYNQSRIKYLVSFLKIRENHEKFVEKVEFYSSISGAGSGFRIRIRIQHGNLNPDPTGSGSETLVITHICE